MCSAEKFGAASGERRTGAIVPPISHHPTHHFSPNKRQIRSAFERGFLPFLPGSAQNIENDVTYSKQSIAKFLTETRIALLISMPGPLFAEEFSSQNCISNRFCTKNRSCRKEMIKPSLIGSRFACKGLQSPAEFRAAPHAPRKKESASRDASEQGKIPLKAQNEKERSEEH